jgi:TM2 domain-containing membrane protein YozV
MKSTLFALVFAFAFPLAAQTPSTPASPGTRDVVAAELIELFVPGGGQMYAGETGRGIALLGLSLGRIIIGKNITATANPRLFRLSGQDTGLPGGTDRRPLVIGGALGAAVRISF